MNASSVSWERLRNRWLRGGQERKAGTDVADFSFLLRGPESSHELLTIIVRFAPILVSTLDQYLVSTPYQHFFSSIQEMLGKVLRSDIESLLTRLGLFCLPGKYLRPFDSTFHTNTKKPA